MSDIAIRFEGLLLAGWLAVAAFIFLLAAIGTALARFVTPKHGRRFSAAARLASVFALLKLGALGIVIAYLARRNSPTAGRDWLDWLTIPGIVFFVIGCAVIARRNSAVPHAVPSCDGIATHK
jgi:hypothetical protein